MAEVGCPVNGAGRSRRAPTHKRACAASSRQFASGFMTDLMARDLGLAVGVGYRSRLTSGCSFLRSREPATLSGPLPISYLRF
jgi:hypothetical protein